MDTIEDLRSAKLSRHCTLEHLQNDVRPEIIYIAYNNNNTRFYSITR